LLLLPLPGLLTLLLALLLACLDLSARQLLSLGQESPTLGVSERLLLRVASAASACGLHHRSTSEIGATGGSGDASSVDRLEGVVFNLSLTSRSKVANASKRVLGSEEFGRNQ
jgi:hypothetical protein